jgi:hypothetical protein
MLHGFLKPAWQSKSSEKRRLAIVKMDASNKDNQTIFATLANNDPSKDVQVECIKKLNDPSTLFELSQSTSDIKTIASEVLGKLIGQKSDISLVQLNEFLSKHPSASTIIIEVAPFPELRHNLVADADEISLAEIIAVVNYAETRSVIAERISDLETLELARKNLKGKDKKAERILRSKIEQIRLTQKHLETNQSAADELLSNMQFIATHPQWRTEFKARFELYTSRWAALEPTIHSDTIDSFDEFKKVAKDKVEAQEFIEQTQIEQLQLVEKLETYCCVTLSSLSLDDLHNEQLSINTILADAITTWLQLNKQHTADSSLSDRFLTAERALEWLSILVSDNTESAIKESRWPNTYPRLTAYVQAQELYQQQRLDAKTNLASEKRALDSLHQRLNRLMGTTKQGDLRKARHELSAVTNAVTKHSGKERLQLDDRLLNARETVQKMEDWHVFATEPKLIELCEEMEGLAKSTSHADKLAEKIAKLQQRWKALGHSEAADTHWPRFKVSADRAYEPCAVFFAKRKETQKQNLQKREPFISEMKTLLETTDWLDQPDYRAVEQALKDIDMKWRNIKDVERNAGQRQWNKLKSLKEQIYTHLDPVYDANIELKQTVVRQIEQLLSSDLQEDSLDKLKLFQGRWKHIGVTRRKQDQALWKEFKHKSDAVYEKISSMRSDRKAQEDEQLKLYKDIINDITSLARNAKTLAQADSQFDDLQQRYQSLPALPKEIPEKLIERLENDYSRSQTAFSNGREKLISKAQGAQFEQLILKATLCSELELAIDNQSNTADIDELRASIEDIKLADKDWEDGIQKRLTKVENQDKKSANEHRRRLCIELEILSEVDSPNEDKALRMSIQLDRMKNQGLIAAAQDTNKACKAIEIDWYTSEGAEPKIQAQLQRRFSNIVDTKNK